MGYYAYCVVPPHHSVPAEIEGLGGSKVFSRPLGDLSVWLSEIERPAAGVDSAQAHNRVVEAAVTEEVTPVPLRFGQWAEELSALEKAITDKSDWYVDRLRLFRAALEFGVRVVDPGRAQSAQVLRSQTVVTGVDYMKALRERAVAAQAQREEVDRVSAIIADVLGQYVRETKVEQPQTTHGLVNVVHLVSRACFDTYRANAATLKARLPDLHLLLSGPWVPYSFAV